MNIEQAKKIDIASFVEWATEEGKRRSIKVEVDTLIPSRPTVRVHVYDYDLMGSQWGVTHADQIDIAKAQAEALEREKEKARKLLGITA